MSLKDPRVDAYITKSADFAKPILNRIRKLVHAACPDVTETIKWSSPFYEYKGILLATPAFKKHCRLIFWKGRMFLGKERNNLSCIASLADLPADKTLTGYLRKAIALNEGGVKQPANAKPKAKKEVVVPDYFLAALRRNKGALAAFEKFSPSHKREYAEWIVEAKREETRIKRIKAAIGLIAQGKSRYWKYQS